MKMAHGRRSYRMTARAEAAAGTGERILDAAEHLFWAGPVEQISLGDIASRAGVSVQTVIRRYRSKNGVIDAAASRASDRVRRQRDQAPIGDVPGAVSNVLDHYEAMGDRVLRLLAEEDSGPTLQRITADGRLLHREWVQRTFAPQLASYRGVHRRRRLAQLVAITDVYMWKILRRDAGLSRRQVELALTELIDGLEKS